LIQQGDLIALAALGDDGDDCLASHVAAQDEYIDFVKFARADKFLPTDFRTVHVRGKKELHADFLSLVWYFVIASAFCEAISWLGGDCFVVPPRNDTPLHVSLRAFFAK
jgi:hypothetical protein